MRGLESSLGGCAADDFFMSRYKEAYVQETLAFVDSLVNDQPAPSSGIANMR